MNRNQAKALLPIIQAYAEGKEIEIFDFTINMWRTAMLPHFDCDSNIYRIKPEPKYRPFKDAEECWQEMQKHQPIGWIKRNGYYYNIISTGVVSVTIIDTKGNIIRLNYNDLLSHYNFIDGTLVGIEKKNEHE